MQIASVLLARFYGLFEITELNRSGTVYYPEVVAGLVERYGFMKYPTKPEEFDEEKGIEFIGGRSGKRVIEKLVILSSGIYLDTGIDTDASESLWFELMEWAVQTLGVSFSPEIVTRRVYVSSLIFRTEVPMLAVHPMCAEIGRIASEQVERNYGRSLNYEPAGISIAFDQTLTKLGTAAFTVQRREGVPFSENKYFSSAPVKTDIHIELLQMWETAIKTTSARWLP
jgi:hypothetical protein